MSTTPPTNPPQWYPDPTGRFQLRYWDGAAWTPHVSTAGTTSVDPEPLSTPPRPLKASRRRRRGFVAAAVIGAVAIGVAVLVIANRTVFTNHLLKADFNSGGRPFSTGSSPDYTFNVLDGTYHITSRTPGPSPAYSFAQFARTAYTVDISADVVSVVGAESFGVGCFTTKNSGYVLLAVPGGGAALARVGQSGGSNNNRIIATNEQAAVPSTNVRIQLSCTNKLIGSSATVTGYVNGQQVVQGTDPHGLNGFSIGALEFGAQTAGAEGRFDNVVAEVPS